jgi:PAS domain S-box-containing protein
LINDITDRKQAEKILRDSEFRYRSLYETMREEVALHGVVYDEAGHPIDYRILDVNPAFTAITGITSEQAVGALASELYGTGEPPYLDIYARVAETGESEHFETYFAPMDKHFSISCISPQKGFFATVATDVTDHKKLETELRQSEKMRAIGQLAGGVAHDFNNQLAGILGYASMLESRVEDPKLVEYARGIITASKRSAELTQKLLDFSRKGRMLAMPVSAHGMIQEVSSMLGHSIDKRIRILQNLTAEWDVVLGDPTQLENALLNLCLNARDAMPDGGELMLRTQNVTLREEDLLVSHNQIPPGKYLAIVVSDTGCGIKEEILPHIFEPFFTTKESGQGTGMGLAAVFGAVKSHHGGIEVYSEPNQGSAFTIYLPVSEESADFSYAGTPSGVVQKGTRILLVEDEEFIRKVMMEMLTDLGYAVETCSNGEEAVQYYKTHWEEVDLVFLDMIMPKMNGREAFLEMKKINSDIHAILLSGYGQNQEVQEMIDQGMHGFIQKPVGQAELAAKIGEILNP